LTAGKRQVIQAITLRYFNNERIRATPEIVYHAVRASFAVADDAGIDSVATYLWAIRDGYGTAPLGAMAAALVSAAADPATRRYLRSELGSQAVLASRRVLSDDQYCRSMSMRVAA
jgi:hypothetical protein